MGRYSREAYKITQALSRLAPYTVFHGMETSPQARQRDASDGAAAEAKLKQRESELETILDNVPVIISSIDSRADSGASIGCTRPCSAVPRNGSWGGI